MIYIYINTHGLGIILVVDTLPDAHSNIDLLYKARASPN